VERERAKDHIEGCPGEGQRFRKVGGEHERATVEPRTRKVEHRIADVDCRDGCAGVDEPQGVLPRRATGMEHAQTGDGSEERANCGSFVVRVIGVGARVFGIRLGEGIVVAEWTRRAQ